MATFRAGQRVRIVRSLTGRFVGMEATVMSEAKMFYAVNKGAEQFSHRINVDGFGDRDSDGLYFLALPEWLEPIQPEGRKVIAWSECLWQPKNAEETIAA